MRICFLAPEFMPNWGGSGSYTINLLKHLPNDLELHIIAPRREIDGTTRTQMKTPQETLGHYVEIHYVSTAEDTFFYNARFQTACAKELPHLQSQYHFDLVHSNHCHMPDLYYQLTRRERIPTVTTVHDFLSIKRANIRKSGVAFNKLDMSEKGILATYPFLRICEFFYLKRIPAFIAPSQCVTRILTSYGVEPKRIIHIPNGVDTSAFAPAHPKNKNARPTVLFTGRLVSHKGIDTIIRAIPHVLKEVRDVQFIFSGAGMHAQYLNQIKGSDILEHIKFLGYVEDYFDMARLYSLADVFVLPSLFENCPMSLLEAMSSEVPVIATSVGGIPEIVTSERNGILIRPNDSRALADSITLLLLDKSYASRLASEGRQTVLHNFSGDLMAERTMRAYEAILRTGWRS
jgi:glycosyltransferase involved in cell wall biosynthesis